MSATQPIDDMPEANEHVDVWAICLACSGEFIERHYGGQDEPALYCSPECEDGDDTYLGEF